MANLQSTSISGSLDYLKEEIITTTNRTLLLTDVGKVITCNSSSDIIITIPTDNSVNFPVGSFVFVSRIGTGNVKINFSTPTTVNGFTGFIATQGFLGNYEEIMLRKRGSDAWQLLEEKTFYKSGSGGTQLDLNIAKVHSYTTTGTDTFIVN